MDSFLAIFANIHWGFVISMLVVSTVLGMLWFGDMLFGHLYTKWMGFTKTYIESCKKSGFKGMAGVLFGEILTRLVFFIALGEVFRSSPSSWSAGFGMAIVLWIFFVLTTHVSQTLWTAADKRVILLNAGNTCLQVILSSVVWYFVFQV